MLAQPTHELDDVAGQFMAHRSKLYAIAYRTLGSPWSADDAVQDAWVRLQRADIASIKNLEAWLTTVISRVCIDMIRQHTSRREDLDDEPGTELSAAVGLSSDPATTAMLADDVAVAMQVVLDTLSPLERLTLVLHDVFALSYDDIAPIVERTPVAARQLASRARARLRSVDVNGVRERQRTAISAFLDAARQGDFGGLLQLLDSDITLRSDDAAVSLAADGVDYGAPFLERRVTGVDAVARVFAGRAELTQLVFVDGVPAAAYVTDDTVHAVYLITFKGERIVTLDVLAGSASLTTLTAQLD